MSEDGLHGEEEKLRSCYRKSLQLAHEIHADSIAFPLISTGSFGYPKEEGLRIAVDEVNTFLLSHEMLIYLVVFDQKTSKLGTRLYPDLESYIDQKYVEEKRQEEYFGAYDGGNFVPSMGSDTTAVFSDYSQRRRREEPDRRSRNMMPSQASSEPLPPQTAKKKGIFPEFSWKKKDKKPEQEVFQEELKEFSTVDAVSFEEDDYLDFESLHESKLQERMRHLSDTFSQYLLYLIQSKNMENAEVYKRAIVDKKIFSKIKNNVNYHPQKMTALCLCIGAKLNLDESRDLLARAGYALSPCDKTDVIFSYFIENKIYDMIELDIQLEEHGLPCIIS